MARREYSDEYKREAMQLSRVPGATIQGVAQELGINGHMLGRWRKVLEEHGEGAFPSQGYARDQEMMQLKRERVNRRRYRTRSEARADLFDYIEGFYNPRMQSRLEREKNNKIRLFKTVRETGT